MSLSPVATDATRLQLFDTVRERLQRIPEVLTSPNNLPAEATETFSFFEALFINAIEGIDVSVDNAKKLLFSTKQTTQLDYSELALRGTYDFAREQHKDPAWPLELGEFRDLFRECHAAVEQGNPEETPGEFRTVTTRFGSTVFTRPDEIAGTLDQGYIAQAQFDVGIKKAAFMVMLLTEVQPFLHGSGKVGLLMMNRALLSCGEHPILIPPALTYFYIVALKQISQQQTIIPLLRVLNHAQTYTAKLNLTSFAATLASLQQTHALNRNYSAQLVMP